MAASSKQQMLEAPDSLKLSLRWDATKGDEYRQAWLDVENVEAPRPKGK